MILSSDKSRCIDIGHAIHMEVVEEGRREGVWAYLFHDGKGQAWFEKCKPAVFKDGKLIERAGVPYRRFSPALVEKMRRHKDELRVYARWCEEDPFTRSGVGGQVKSRREIAAARCAALVAGQVANTGVNKVANTPPPGVGSEKAVISNAGNGKGERTQLTNEK